MSIWTNIRNKAAVAVATYYGGAAGGATVAKYQDARGKQHAAKDYEMSIVNENNYKNLPALINTGMNVISGSAASSVVGAVLPGAGRVLSGRLGRVAGGVATGVASALIYDAAGNVIGRRARRRSKGISASQLKAFTRVTALLNKYCKTPPPTKRRTTGARKCR